MLLRNLKQICGFVDKYQYSLIVNRHMYTLSGARGISNVGMCAPRLFRREGSLYSGGKDTNTNRTVYDELKKWNKIFTEKRISEPLESIANILAHALNSNKIADVYAKKDQRLDCEEIREIRKMCTQRLESMPLQYILGEWEFRELTLKLRPPVFIPRPETEILVELALLDIKETGVCKILELCCGSGAISLALLNQIPDLHVVAVDKSNEACKLTQENAIALNLNDRLKIHNVEVKDVFKKIPSESTFDLIISNPPYVLTEDMLTLQPEILLYEDHEALDGGRDGFDVIKQIFTVSSRFLNPCGKLFLEVDPSHPQLIPTYLVRNEDLRLRYHRAHHDLNGVERFVEILKLAE